MDYEKKYKEALKRARANYKADKEMGFLENCDMLELIFPELAESEDERIRIELKEAFEAYDIESKWNGIPIRSIFAWLEKQKEQKPAEWSDEDSDNLERVDNYLWMLDNYVGDDCATPQGKSDKIRGNIQEVLSPWLKNLPKRINPQPKPEWSEEDGEMLDSIIRVVCGVGIQPNGLREKQVSWLKSLRPSWKPSEHQMNILKAVKDYVGKGSGYWGEGLGSLIEDLKKL